ncbi:MAG: membrane dipeptidase [Sneathiellaceae bacterium]
MNVQAGADWGVSERAAKLQREAFVCDMTSPWSAPGDPDLQAALPGRMKRAGFDFMTLTVGTDDHDPATALAEVARNRRFILSRPDELVLALRADDIPRARAEGKLAVGLHFQGTTPVARNLDLVEAFHALGIRHMLMAYNQKNFVADGCHELTDCGISRFGRSLIAEMERVGMFVDVAHTGYRSSLETIDAATGPVICSHGNVWARFEHPRAYRDDQIKAIAATGGAIGITGLGIFMGNNDASLETYVAQIDHVAQLVGPEHVGFGFDYIYDVPALVAISAKLGTKWPKGYGYDNTEINQVEPEMAPRITEALLGRGYDEAAVGNIIGGNWLRLIRQVWK